MEYVSCIKDELGTVVYICSDLSEKDIDKILSTHPEWNRSVVYCI